MDWASAEWKQALTPLAVQKVNALEEKIEKLQKEKQQKQLQYECLELALEKEKRKTEKEKQQTIEVQRELQSLADICKDFESKQQKLQNELQIRDSKIKNLEVLLSQSKKETSKLQQLVSDLKDVNSLRENTLLEREQKLQKSNRENNPNQSMDNFEIENSSKQKIAEQDALIMELRTNLTLIAKKDELNETSNDPFKTPKSKSVSVTDSPAVNSKNTSNIWDGFRSTPAKGNKDRILGHRESSSIDSGDEKLMSLQTRLKQLCQELDCQRHNFEASKNALEMKYKENEATLKADLKYQVQANAELDKQLKDSKNKYQQELSQATKKLDLLTLQLKKTEEAKALIEQDLKSMESKLLSNESVLRIKEEQLQDLQKSKLACDSSLQLLQFQVTEFEQKYKVLTEEKNALSENIKVYEVQLEGSNNLVKEKEVGLLEAQRKLQNVQVKMQDLENQFKVQEENLQKSKMNETSLLEEIEFLKQEKEELNISLNSEITKCKSMEMIANELKEKLLSANEELGILQNKLQENFSVETSLKEQVERLQISNKEFSDSLTKETDIIDCLKRNLDEEAQKTSALKEEYSSICLELEEAKGKLQISIKENQENVHEMEGTLKDMKLELSALQNQLQQSSSLKVCLNEKIQQLEIANTELSGCLNEERNKNDCLKLDLEEECQKMSVLKDQLSHKCLEMEQLNKQILNSQNQYENEIQELNFTMSDKYEDKKTSTETELKAFEWDERSFKENTEMLEQDKVELSKQLKLEVSKVHQLKLLIDEEKQKCSLLESKLENKSLKFEELNDLMKVLLADLVKSMLQLDEKLHAAKQENDALQIQLQETSTLKASLKEKVEQLEFSNKELSDKITAETNKSDCLKWNLDKEAQKMSSVGEELSLKCLELEEIKNQILFSKNQFETQLQELKATLRTSEDKVLSLEAQLKDSYTNENIAIEKLVLAEKEKLELTNQLNLLTAEFQQLELAMADEKKACSSLKETLTSTCAELEESSERMKNLNDAHETQLQELKATLRTSEDKVLFLEAQLEDNYTNENIAMEKLELAKKEKLELTNQLNLLTAEFQQLELAMADEKKACSSLKETFTSTYAELEESSERMKNLNDAHETQLQELKAMLTTSEDKVLFLEAQLKDNYTNENIAVEKLALAEKEKLEITNQLNLLTAEFQQLESAMADEKKACSSLKETLTSTYAELQEFSNQVKNLNDAYELKVKELESKFSSAEAKTLILENQLKKIVSVKISAEQEIEVAERDKSELLNELKLKTMKIQELESSIKMEKLACSLLKESFSKEFQKLNVQMKEFNSLHEEKVTEFEEKFSSTEQKCLMLETKIQEYSANKVPAKQIESLEQEKSELANQLKLEVSKVEQLEISIEEGKKECSLIKEKLEQKCLQLEDLNSQMKMLKNEHKIDLLLNMENEILSTKEEKACLEYKLQEISQHLAAEIHKSQCLEQELENSKMFVMSLDESLLQLYFMQDDLEKKFDISVNNYKNIIKDLESKLAVAEADCSSLNSEREKSSLHEVELKKQLYILINDKKKATDEGTKITSKCLQMEQEYKNIINEFENQLAVAEAECNILKSEREESSLHEMELKQQLDILISEKKDAIDEVTDVTRKYVQLEQEQEQKIQDYENRMLIAQTMETELKLQLQEFSSKEESLKNSLALLEKEKFEMADKLKVEVCKSEELELLIQDLKKSCASFEKELSFKALKLEEAEKQRMTLTNESRNIIKDLESKLAAVDIECSTLKSENEEFTLHEIELKQQLDTLMNEKKNAVDELAKMIRNFEELEQEHKHNIEDFKRQLQIVSTESQQQLQDMSEKEECLKKSLSLLEKEKAEISDKLKIEICKSEELELLVQDLKKSCASFEEELSFKSLKLQEAESHKMTLTKESRVLGHTYNCNENMQGGFGSKSWQCNDIQLENLAVSSHKHFDDPKMLIPTYQDRESIKSLHKFSLCSLEEIHSLEQDLITQLETLKFLCHYKLIGKSYLTRIWKRFLLLSEKLRQIQFLKKFMFCVQDILKSSLNTQKLNDSYVMLLAVILPKRLHLAVQDLYHMCGDTLSKVLCVVSQNLQRCKSDVEQCSIIISSVHNNHLPVITSTKYILNLHKISRTYINSNSRSPHQDPLEENCFEKINIDQELNMKKALSILNVQDLPHFMNYAAALTEYILKPSSIVSYLNSPTNLHPVLHLLRQYLFDSLNLKSMDEIHYWKNYHNILGVPEDDFVKIISLFKCKSQYEEIPSEVVENLSLEVRNLKSECAVLKADKEALNNALLAEKQKQQSLNATIEEIEHDLGETFQQKQNYKNMVLKTSEVLSQLKTSMGTAKTFLSINFSSTFSDKSCFCEMCMDDGEINENSSHEKLTLCYLLESIERLIQMGCQLETEILKFNQYDLTVMYKELQDRNSELEILLANSNVSSKDTHDEIGNLKYELSKEKLNCEQIYHAADEKDILILELESSITDLSNTVKVYKEKLNLCEEKNLKLSADLERLSVLSTKEDKRDSLTKTMKDKTLAYENALLKCKEYECKIQTLITDNSRLEEQNAVALSSREKKIDTLKKTLEEKAILCENIQMKCKEYESKINLLNSVISKLDDQNAAAFSAKESEKNVLRSAIEEKESLYEGSQLKCKEYENKVKLLSDAISKLEEQKTIAILSKEEEIDTLRKNMAEEASQCENIKLKCKEHESKIQLLKSTISKLEEEKALGKHLNALQSTRNLANELADGKSPKETITQLQRKVESLKNSNDSLSLTVEAMKKELSTAYVEKQDIEESEKLTKERNIELQEEVSRATQKYICEKQAKEELLSKLQESEKLKVDSESVINQLRVKNERLDKDINVLKVVLREHEKAILSKNSSLKAKNQIIDELNIKISEMEQEKIDFESNLKNMENPLKIQLEDMTKQCSLLAAEIKRLQLVEVEKLMIEENILEIETQRDALIEESNSLRKELENISEQLKYQEVKNQELKLKNKEASEALNLEISLRTSLEEELAEKQNSIVNLNEQLQKLKISEDKLRLLESEQSKVNSVLKQQIEVHEREVNKISAALKQAKEELCHQQQFATESEELIGKLKESQKENCALVSALDGSKSALNNATQFITKLLDIIIVHIGSYSDYPNSDKLKSSLTSLLVYWKQGSESSAKSKEKFMNEVFDDLDTFYRIQVNNHKEEIAMRNHILSIIDCVNDMGLFCETNAQNPQPCNFADVTNMSLFDTTLLGNFGEIVKTPHSPKSLLMELQKTKKLLEECFDSLKSTTLKQAEEIGRLKKKLSELASKSISSDNEVIEKNKSMFKGKYNLIKIQFQRLEKDYNELVITCKGMEEQIKTLEKDKNVLEEEKKLLEKEKQDLEEEANELAEDVKRIEAQYNSSQELLDALTESANLRHKLSQVENEKNYLKQMLEYYQPKDDKKGVRNNEGLSYALGTTDSKENVRRIDKFMS